VHAERVLEIVAYSDDDLCACADSQKRRRHHQRPADLTEGFDLQARAVSPFRLPPASSGTKRDPPHGVARFARRVPVVVGHHHRPARDVVAMCARDQARKEQSGPDDRGHAGKARPFSV
jgi:hypothetical protein